MNNYYSNGGLLLSNNQIESIAQMALLGQIKSVEEPKTNNPFIRQANDCARYCLEWVNKNKHKNN